MSKLHNFFCELFRDGSFLKHVTDGNVGTSAEEETTGFIAELLRLTDNK